jgi:hypothetical protein
MAKEENSTEWMILSMYERGSPSTLLRDIFGDTLQGLGMDKKVVPQLLDLIELRMPLDMKSSCRSRSAIRAMTRATEGWRAHLTKQRALADVVLIQSIFRRSRARKQYLPLSRCLRSRCGALSVPLPLCSCVTVTAVIGVVTAVIGVVTAVVVVVVTAVVVAVADTVAVGTIAFKLSFIASVTTALLTVNAHLLVCVLCVSAHLARRRTTIRTQGAVAHEEHAVPCLSAHGTSVRRSSADRGELLPNCASERIEVSVCFIAVPCCVCQATGNALFYVNF